MRKFCKRLSSMILLLSVLSAGISHASAPFHERMKALQAMPPEQREAAMTDMMHSAAKMQDCVNQAGGNDVLKELEEYTKAHVARIDALCASGEREKAKAYAQDAAGELLKDPRVVKLQGCSADILKDVDQFETLLEARTMDDKRVCD